LATLLFNLFGCGNDNHLVAFSQFLGLIAELTEGKS